MVFGAIHRWGVVLTLIVVLLLSSCGSTPPTVSSLGQDLESPESTTSLQIAPAPRAGFQIDLNFTTPLTFTQRQAFEQAASRWSRIISADLPDIFLDENGLLVDDVLIDVSTPLLDGIGGVLGQAEPRLIRTQSGLPILGIMEFDSADLTQLESDDSLDEIILHEMAHVLGFGTLWRRFRRFDLLNGFLFPRYTGEQAIAQYQQLFTVSPLLGQTIPLEAFGGQGTRLLHWSEAVFTDELMTGFFDAGQTQISSVTIASLADLGYAVDLTEADPFRAGRSISGRILGRCGTREVPLLREIDESTHSPKSNY